MDARVVAEKSQPESHLKAGLKSRHLTMMSIAGVIGGSLFVGSGSVIHSAGPAAVLAFLTGGILMMLIMRMLGEMATASPDTGSFSTYADRAIGRWAGFTIGWLYWGYWVALMAWEAYVAGKILNGWFPAVSVNAFVLGTTLLLISINFFNVKNYGEFEFWFALIKVIAIVCFLTVSCLAVLNIWQVGEVSGISNLTAHGFVPNGIEPVVGAMLGVMFAFLGAEIATIAASESKNPSQQIIKTTKSVVWRVGLFYVGSIFLIVCLVPWNDPMLGQSGYGSYRRTLELLGVPGAEWLMNFVVLTSVSSCLISAHYTASRMLFSLASRGDAPACFKLTKADSGVPVYAIIGSCVVAVVMALINFSDTLRPRDVLDTLMNMTGTIALLVYLVIACSQLKMRRKLEASGRDIPLKMWLYPWLTWAVIVFIVVCLGAMSFMPDYQVLVISTGGAGVCLALLGVFHQMRCSRRAQRMSGTVGVSTRG
ncbi:MULTISPECIES: amino acid permease [Pseudomonas]|uniref:Amino acid permease n=1 Tax=Pseudomonas putida TaxID=303 RepID=A0A7W2KZ35_PSEPU|nr:MULTISPECIES: amino acid permease [Pseudomonas]MBA6115221.1 amino acid permease [Pseudomonas putida]MCZ9639403.1 amino acid permease [Pseudomonas putida]QNL88533.1 Gamma-aminobutyrate (GABA) permease [Pseudomonas putida]